MTEGTSKKTSKDLDRLLRVHAAVARCECYLEVRGRSPENILRCMQMEMGLTAYLHEQEDPEESYANARADGAYFLAMKECNQLPFAMTMTRSKIIPAMAGIVATLIVGFFSNLAISNYQDKNQRWNIIYQHVSNNLSQAMKLALNASAYFSKATFDINRVSVSGRNPLPPDMALDIQAHWVEIGSISDYISVLPNDSPAGKAIADALVQTDQQIRQELDCIGAYNMSPSPQKGYACREAHNNTIKSLHKLIVNISGAVGDVDMYK